VAEDHQTRNAQALYRRNAAFMIADDKAEENLVDEALKLVEDENRRKTLSANIKAMADMDADIRIAREILKLTVK